MEVLEAIRRRRAVRDYKPDAVPSAVLHQLVSAASWAPSAMNEQPWQFTVVTDRELMDEISTLAKSAMLKNLTAMPRPSHFQDILGDPHYRIFYAPVLLVVSAPADRAWCTEDCALAAQNLMLAAIDLGLGSCWVGFAQLWLNTEEGLHILGLPRTQRVVAPIILGYPKVQPPSVARKSPALNWIGNGLKRAEINRITWPAGPAGSSMKYVMPKDLDGWPRLGIFLCVCLVLCAFFAGLILLVRFGM